MATFNYLIGDFEGDCFLFGDLLAGDGEAGGEPLKKVEF
jgi:hypothetical protein